MQVNMKASLRIYFSALIASCIFTPALSSAGELDQLTYITESYPPYNFESKGESKGIAVDLLMAATKISTASSSVPSLQFFPWPRAYKMAQDGPNVVLFSTTRTKQREKIFNWVGPITSTRIVLIAKKSNAIIINHSSDIAKHLIGAITDDIGDQLVQEAGVKSSAIEHVSTAKSLVKMLATDRIKLWAYEENVARWFIKESGFDNSQFESVYTLKEGDLYFAFSKDINKKTLDLLQDSINEVKASGEFSAIKANYL